MKYEIALSVFLQLTMVNVFGNEIRSTIEIEDTIKKVLQKFTFILRFLKSTFQFFQVYHLKK